MPDEPSGLEPSTTWLPRNLLLLPYALRRAGLPVSTGQTLDWADALTRIDLGRREDVYHASRALLTTGVEHHRLFDILFDKLFGAASVMAPGRTRKPRPRPSKAEPVLVSYMAARPQAAEVEIEDRDRRGTYSSVDRLQTKSFGAMSADELDHVKRLLHTFRWDAALRKTRRFEVASRGESLAMRRVLASAARHAGHPLELPRRRRKEKERPIVLLVDISGSMERYSRIFLHFFYAMAHAFRDVEAFAFGTRLTRLTDALRLKNVDRAVQEASESIVDFAGGTRIAESFGAFNRQWGRRVLGRGAIVLVLSDGWERGSARNLGIELATIAKRCHRLIWMNPHLAREGYAPRVEGMHAALPYLDDFLPLDSLKDIRDLAAHLAHLPKRKGSRSGILR